ncbi:MAG: dTMP kinase [Gammaproteobacteria bacterium]|nr:dTMP kinase [Gammaproteobacteria bacterium]
MVQTTPLHTGRFISLEGVEGVGKSTNLVFIVEYLQQQGVHVVQTREPGGTVAGERIRELLLDPDLAISDATELLLMFASRSQLVTQVIRPALEAGHWVVSDRFTDASFAYQGGGRGMGSERVAALESWVLEGLKPDCTLLLDLPVDKGLARLASRSHKDRIEQEQNSFFQRVREAYLSRVAADPERFRVIDASKPLEQVQTAIAHELDKVLACAAPVTDA